MLIVLLLLADIPVHRSRSERRCAHQRRKNKRRKYNTVEKKKAVYCLGTPDNTSVFRVVCVNDVTDVRSEAGAEGNK